MKYGICECDTDIIRIAYETGFDFIEVNNSVIYSMDSDRYGSMLTLSRSLPEGYLYACNGLVKADIRLTGPEVDYNVIRNFSKESFYKVAELGVKMLVFGSSKAKQVPEGFSFEEAQKQLTEVVCIFAETAESYGQKVCIEPLRTEECNIINTAEDSIALAKASGCTNVGGHVDYFHMMQNGEKMSKLSLLGKDIIHTHIASPCVRRMPEPDDGADYRQFIKYLQMGSYDKTVSYEGRGEKTRENLTSLLEFFRSL